MTNNNIIQSAYYNKCNISVNGTGEAKTDDGEAQSDSAKIADKEDSAVDCEDSDRNIEAQPHLIHDEGHSGTKLSPDGSTPDSLVALDGKDNSSNADLGEDQSDSTKDPGGTCGDISYENRAQDFDGPTGLSAPLQFPPGGGEGPIHDQPPSVPPPLGGWVTLHQEGQSGSANDTGGTAGAISYKTGVTCENTGAEDKSDTAKDVESINQAKCHKGANGNVGDASSEEAAEACLAGVSHDNKVIIPDDLFPQTLKGFIDKDEAHKEMFTKFAHVFDGLTRLEIEHDQKDTPEEKAWKNIRVAGRKALEVCISTRFRNDSFLVSLMPFYIWEMIFK